MMPQDPDLLAGPFHSGGRVIGSAGGSFVCLRWQTLAVEEKKFWNPPRSPSPMPVVREVDPAAVDGATMAKDPLPVFVMLDYDNSETLEVPAFAYGWTKTLVLVNVPWPMDYFEGRKKVWVEASRVRRRRLDPRVG